MLEGNVYDDANNELERLTIINTNARSLCPKIDSMIDYFNELECTFSIITETWMSDGEHLQNDIRDLQDGAGITMLCKNRQRNHQGVSHGGVSIWSRDSRARIAPVKLHNPGNFEVLAGVASLKGHSRKMVIFACYLPPSMDANSSSECLDFIVNSIHVVKRKYDDPHIVVGGISTNSPRQLLSRNTRRLVRRGLEQQEEIGI